MTTIGEDIEVGLSEEDIEIRDTVRKFAAEVLRPAGAELDRIADPADGIAPGSVLWKVVDKYRSLGIGDLTRDEEMDPIRKARLSAVVSEELAWGDVGLAITLGLSNFHQPWIEQSGDAELIERFCSPDNFSFG